MSTLDTDDGRSLPPFLARRTPHWAARGLTYLLLLLFVAAAAAVIVLRVPEVVAGSFVIVPATGSDPVRAPRRGIVAEVRVREGEDVREGATIAVIGSEETGDRSADLATLETEERGAANARANARQKYDSERRADADEERQLRARIEDLNRRVALKQQQVALKTQVVEGRRKLHAEGLTSSEDLVAHQLEFQQYLLDQKELEGQRDATREAIAKLQHQSEARAAEFAEIKRRLDEDMEKNRLRLEMLREGPSRTERGSMILTAPCPGRVVRLLVNGRGAVVHEGEVVTEIACVAGQLRADVILPQSGVPRVHVGQRVKLLYEAFPYERFGARYGTLRWISPGSAAERERAIFRAVVDPDPQGFTIDGQARPILPGMSGRAEVVIGSRSMASYALDPLRQLQESVSTPPDRVP